MAAALAASQACLAQSAAPTVPAGFRIEAFADVDEAHALTAVPLALQGLFGDCVYVCAGLLDGATSPSQPNDRIVRIECATGAATVFTELPAEADPIDLAFGTGGAYGNDLYVCENNRDNFRAGDFGGAIARVPANPGAFGEILVTGMGLPNGPTEPTGMVFVPAAFGGQLWIGNATNPPFGIQTVSAGGSVGNLIPWAFHRLCLTMGPGGVFGDDLYVGEQSFSNPGRITHLSAPFAPLATLVDLGTDLYGLAFAPPGAFDGFLYVALANSVVRVSPAGVVESFATGFSGLVGSLRALAFSADGHSLYVLDRVADRIWRITDLGTIAVSHVSTCAGGLVLSVVGNPQVAGALTATASGVTGLPFVLIGFPPRNTALLDPAPCGVGCHVVGPAPGIGDLAFGATRNLAIPASAALVGIRLDFQALDFQPTVPNCDAYGLPLDLSDIVTAVVE